MSDTDQLNNLKTSKEEDQNISDLISLSCDVLKSLFF
jgi:hypothetical protein